MITEILTHIADAKKRLIQQYKGKPRIESLVEAFVQDFQNLETVGKDLNENRSIDTATGNTLDRLGDIVGLDRESGQSDDDYRILLKSKIGQNVSQGEPERIIDIARVLTGANLVLLDERYPAGLAVGVDVPVPTQDEINMLIEILDKASAAGVRFEGISFFDPTEAFAFAGSLPGLGFSSTATPLLGGKLATIKEALYPFAFDGDNPNYLGFGSTGDVLVGGAFI
jgi:hypothetical protein